MLMCIYPESVKLDYIKMLETYIKSGILGILSSMIFCTHLVQIQSSKFLIKKSVFISFSALFCNLNFTDSGLYKDHPLAKEKSISILQLTDYPCLSFRQGERSSIYFAEEILSDIDYQRTIKTNDRGTMLDLMKGLDGYTLCSGIICEQINGSDYVTVPFKEDENNRNCVMTIGYIMKEGFSPGEIAKVYIEQLKQCIQKIQNNISQSMSTFSEEKTDDLS